MINTLQTWTPGRISAAVLVILGLVLITLPETVIPFDVGQVLAGCLLLVGAVVMPLLYRRRTQHFRSALKTA